MKIAKRILSVLVVLTMILASSISAFAADDGKIIISNPQDGVTYNAYKLFDVTYDGDNYAYTASAEIKTLLDGNVAGLTFTENSTGSYTVTKTGDYSPATMAAYIKTNFASFETALGEAKTFTAVGDGSIASGGLPRGYYFVTSSVGTLCELTTAQTVTIEDKNEKPAIEKTVSDSDKTVEVGEKLEFNIKGKVPTTTGYTSYTYEVSDTMTAGLTFNKDVKVYIGGTDQTGNVSVTNNTAGDGFVVKIDMTKFQRYLGQFVNIEYSATVNDAAIARNVESNSATLTYSNDPTDSTKTGTSTKTVNVYSYNIVIDKYTMNGSDNVKLANAKFVLKDSTKTKYYKWDETTKTVSWVSAKADATEVITNDQGVASFNGLQAGTYYLEETAAPAGYNPLSKDTNIAITITENENAATVHTATVNNAQSNPSDDDLTVTASVENSAGTILPETGNIGTMLFIVLGGLAVIVAGIFLVTNKRMSKESF